MIAILDLGDDEEPDLTPHPALVAAAKPTARDFLTAVSLLGWLPEEPLIPFAVIGRSEED